VKSVQCFDLIYLFAESRLGDVQSVGGPSEVQLFGQDNHGVQVTYFNPGEHSSSSLSSSEIAHCPTSSQGTGSAEKYQEISYFSPIGRKGRWTRRMLDTDQAA
jgi:hypothetical protein